MVRPSSDATATTVYVSVVDNGKVFPGLDIDCSGCLAPTSVPTDNNGVAKFTAQPDQFSHLIQPYFKASIQGYYPLILWPMWSLTGTSVFSYPITPQKDIDSMPGNRVTPDGLLGHIGYVLFNCAGLNTDTLVRVKLTSPSLPNTRVLGFLGDGSVAEDLSVTHGVIFNVPPGVATVEYTVESSPPSPPRPIGRVQVMVEAGSLTEVLLKPTALTTTPQ
jgi:hypothetical protein